MVQWMGKDLVVYMVSSSLCACVCVFVSACVYVFVCASCVCVTYVCHVCRAVAKPLAVVRLLSPLLNFSKKQELKIIRIQFR